MYRTVARGACVYVYITIDVHGHTYIYNMERESVCVCACEEEEAGERTNLFPSLAPATAGLGIEIIEQLAKASAQVDRGAHDDAPVAMPACQSQAAKGNGCLAGVKPDRALPGFW